MGTNGKSVWDKWPEFAAACVARHLDATNMMYCPGCQGPLGLDPNCSHCSHCTEFIAAAMMGYGYNPYADPGHAAKPGDRPKDKECKKCKSKGNLVLAEDPQDKSRFWHCKLCGTSTKI